MKLWFHLLWLACGAVQAQTSPSPCAVVSEDLAALRYEGPCVEGKAHGFGRVFLAPGNAAFEGFFHSGLRHGWGRQRYANGDVYDGQWAADQRFGRGEYRFGANSPWNGDSYEGHWQADRMHGQGTYRWATGDVHTGVWRAGAQLGISTAGQTQRQAWARAFTDQGGRVGMALCWNPALALPAHQVSSPTPSENALRQATVLEIREERVRMRWAAGGREEWLPLSWWRFCPETQAETPK